MKTTGLIVGGLAVALVGTGVYLYYKNKTKTSTAQKSLLDSLYQTASPSGPTTVTSPIIADPILISAPVVTNADLAAKQQELINLTQASNLINQITSLRSTLKPTDWTIQSMQLIKNLSFNQGVDSQIENIKAQMKLLGYQEKNGLAIKI